ncbi:MAG: hypothetical protein H7Y38_20780 [Armatimonadetes bacterium]|nr:hypothetical protein [Armatimonadota bacterium]
MPLFSPRVVHAFFVAAIFSLFPIVANAQEAEPVKPTGTRAQRPYISLYTGTTQAQNADLRLLQPVLGTDATYHDVSWRGRPFSGSPYYGVKVGIFLPKSPRIGFEAEFNHSKMYAKLEERKLLTGTFNGQSVNGVETVGDRVQKYQITNGINSFSLNVLYRVPVAVSVKYPDGRFQPYVGGGPQYTFLYSINIINSLGVKEKYHPNGWGYQLFGGGRFMATPHIGLFLEGKYQHGDAVSLIADQGNTEGGRGITDIRMAQLAGGVFYQF